jgi:hypothetical protein
MELTNYSITFYIYCLFSEDFRNTLLRTMKWPWFGSDKTNIKRNNDVSGGRQPAAAGSRSNQFSPPLSLSLSTVPNDRNAADNHAAQAGSHPSISTAQYEWLRHRQRQIEQHMMSSAHN